MEGTRFGSVCQILNISSWVAFSVRKPAVADRWLEGMLLQFFVDHCPRYLCLIAGGCRWPAALLAYCSDS
jgi:hypothetical protein